MQTRLNNSPWTAKDLGNNQIGSPVGMSNAGGVSYMTGQITNYNLKTVLDNRVVSINWPNIQ